MSPQYRTQNPVTGEITRTYETDTDAAIENALAQAVEAFDQWRKKPVSERAEIVIRVAELFEAKSDELARIISTEMGKPLDESTGEAQFAGEIFRYFAEQGPGQLQEESLGSGIVLQRRPLGPILGVMPWNYPYYQVARFVAPNLISGNVVFLKHAEQCAASALAISAILEEAGVPRGVYQNLFATHDQVARIIADPRLQGVSLTGSERAGAIIAQQAGSNLKKAVLELGGSDPYVVLSSDDPRASARHAATTRYSNMGQACNSNKRMIVMDDIYDEFVEELVKVTAELVPGDPLDPQPQQYYPMSSHEAAERLLQQLQDAEHNGAKLLVGGQQAEGSGYYVAPAVLTDVTADSSAYYEELFGPVATVFRVSSDEEALQLANDTPFGLGASVYSTDLARAEAFGEELEAGMVGVNAQAPETADVPFGGIKRSGYGRELGSLGIDEFVNKRLFYVNR